MTKKDLMKLVNSPDELYALVSICEDIRCNVSRTECEIKRADKRHKEVIERIYNTLKGV